LSSKFKIVRADDLPHPGSITHQIIELLYNADLVVADLTGANANVAYELAIRHCFNKVSIHLVDRTDSIPFDLKDERTVVFDLNDIDSIEGCKRAIKKFVDAITGGKVPYRSPVFRALGVLASTAEERGAFLDKIAEQIDSIATDVSSIDSTLTFSDLDEIDSIKDSVSAIEKSQDELARTLDAIKDEVDKISSKLD
jgi:methyl-accepting chemotaxis protein